MKPAPLKKTDLVDLHIHSLHSDGIWSVREILSNAKKLGLRAVSITDHDTVKALDIAQEISKEYSIEVVPGIELSSTHKQTDIHILGYYPDIHNEELSKTLQIYRTNRAKRAQRIVKKLNDIGIDINYEQVLDAAKDAVIGRPHIAQVLVKEEYVMDFGEAFTKYLGEDMPAFIPKKNLSTQKAIEFIRSLG
ncbi:MAG: PHP domain-containing protein, partial [bacterium]